MEVRSSRVSYTRQWYEWYERGKITVVSRGHVRRGMERVLSGCNGLGKWVDQWVEVG